MRCGSVRTCCEGSWGNFWTYISCPRCESHFLHVSLTVKFPAGLLNCRACWRRYEYVHVFFPPVVSAVWSEHNSHVWKAHDNCKWVTSSSHLPQRAFNRKSACSFGRDFIINLAPSSSFSLSENLPDPGKAQDFMKKFNQVLGEDEKLRLQLEQLISPTCSCKQAEQCVVSTTAVPAIRHRLIERIKNCRIGFFF